MAVFVLTFLIVLVFLLVLTMAFVVTHIAFSHTLYIIYSLLLSL